MFKIELKKKAKKYIEKQDQITQKRIKNSLLILAENPYDYQNKNIKKLKGYNQTYRIRLADLRIEYQIINNELIISVLDIDTRGQIYK